MEFFPVLEMRRVMKSFHSCKYRISHGIEFASNQYYYGEPNHILFTPSTDNGKVVLKVGSAEAGYGKVLLENNNTTLRDFGGVVTRYNDFMTAEPFIDNRRCDISL